MTKNNEEYILDALCPECGEECLVERVDIATSNPCVDETIYVSGCCRAKVDVLDDIDEFINHEDVSKHDYGMK